MFIGRRCYPPGGKASARVAEFDGNRVPALRWNRAGWTRAADWSVDRASDEASLRGTESIVTKQEGAPGGSGRR